MGNKVTLDKGRRLVSDSITRPANATAYTAGDVVSEVTTNDHFTFAHVIDSNAQFGTIKSATCHSSAYVATAPDLELWLFHTDIAEVADNGAFAPTDAEMLTLVGIIDFATGSFYAGNATAGAGGNAVLPVTGLDIPFATIGADSTLGRRLYGQLVIRNAYVPVSGEIFTVSLVIEQN